jgi:uncharacterized membrane protein (UPF0127 family)
MNPVVRFRGIGILLAFLACLTVVLTADASPALPAWRLVTPWTTETATVRFANDTIDAEIADTPELRQRGLGYRDGLAPGTGMLFVDPSPSTQTFWMKGMRFCLDIVWIERGEIKGAAESVCPEPGVADADLSIYTSPEPVTYVLEVPARWLEEHGYGTGTKVEIALPN